MIFKVKAIGRKPYYAPGNRAWIASPYSLEAVEVEVKKVDLKETPLYDRYEVIFVQNMLHGSAVLATVCGAQLFPDKASAEKAITDELLTSAAHKVYKAKKLRQEAALLLYKANALFGEGVTDAETLFERKLSSEEVEEVQAIVENTNCVTDAEEKLKKFFKC